MIQFCTLTIVKSNQTDKFKCFRKKKKEKKKRPCKLSQSILSQYMLRLIIILQQKLHNK